jgi:uncharacterized membrane protein YwaF
MVPVGIANRLLDANYMFLCQRPMVDNPLVIGDWPYYLIAFVVAGALHYVVLTLLFWKRIKAQA